MLPFHDYVGKSVNRWRMNPPAADSKQDILTTDFADIHRLSEKENTSQLDDGR
jgi:hypothetical protein